MNTDKVKQEELVLFPNEQFVTTKDSGGVEAFLRYLEESYRRSIMTGQGKQAGV